jgi:predicted Zn-dependent protease
MSKRVPYSCKYDALKEELYGLYRKAVPYLETSYANEPEDKLVQQTLMQLYGKLGETEKYNKLKAIYEKN